MLDCVTVLTRLTLDRITGFTSLLRHDAGDSEDGQEQGDGDGSDDEAHEGDHEGFDQGGGGADGVLELFFEIDRDAVAGKAELAGFFAGAEHLDDAGGD